RRPVTEAGSLRPYELPNVDPAELLAAGAVATRTVDGIVRLAMAEPTEARIEAVRKLVGGETEIVAVTPSGLRLLAARQTFLHATSQRREPKQQEADEAGRPTETRSRPAPAATGKGQSAVDWISEHQEGAIERLFALLDQNQAAIAALAHAWQQTN